MIDYKWLYVVLFLLATTFLHTSYTAYSAFHAKDAMDEASDSIATLVDARVPMEVREDSLRLVVDAQREALQADSVRWVRELEEASERAQRASARASTLVDSIRVRVDSTTLEFVDSLVVEHDVEVEALTTTVAVLTEEVVALRVANSSLTELLAIGDDLEASLRAEIAQQAVGIGQLQRLLNPPFSLRFLQSAKVGVPMVAVGVALGFFFSN
jgi:hypothetical protein